MAEKLPLADLLTGPFLTKQLVGEVAPIYLDVCQGRGFDLLKRMMGIR